MIDREAGCAVAGNGNPRNVFKHLARAFDIAGKGIPPQREDPGMIPAMAGDLMPGISDPAHQRAMPLCHPTQCEKCAMNIASREQIKDPRDIAFHPVR